jgi:hypothetical protein
VLLPFGNVPLGLFQMAKLHCAIHGHSLEQIRTARDSILRRQPLLPGVHDSLCLVCQHIDVL